MTSISANQPLPTVNSKSCIPAMTTTKTRQRKQYEGPTAEEKLVGELIELLNAGVNPWRKEWSTGANCMKHQNLITGKPYRGSNPIVLEMYMACRGYSLPLWIGVAQAKKEGWMPKKGSKGCYVLRPQLNAYEQKDDDGNVIKDQNGDPVISAWVSFKPVCVFNVSDIKGTTEEAQDKLESLINKTSGCVVIKEEPQRIEAAEAVLGQWCVETNWGGDRACYSPARDQIAMPRREQFSTIESCYATWAHEQAHSTGHSSRLNRDLSGSFGTDAYAREELVAELAAFLICNRLEISSNTENHAAYLNHWAGVLKEGPKVLFKVLSDATKAANAICGPEVEETEP